MTSSLIEIPGYRLIEQLYDSSRTTVYRSLSESDQKPFVIKLLKSEYPTFNELVQFRNQYTIAKNLDLAGIVKPIALLNYRKGFALVMEDIGGVSLSEEIGRISNSLSEFFNIAIQIVQTLEGLYKNRIIHKDIKPQNILINPENREVKLIDFSISSLLPRENQEITNPNVLEGTLAYMSPEQTGRMNRGIDYRTDFYSLGVTFYELLTGQLPFVSTDPMELVHCHIAKIPTPPIEVNPAIPMMVNDIIIKLMAKTAEERYQSTFGLRYDLENCWKQWQETSSICQFILGTRDICERFVIPEKLYGRDREVQTLLSAFERVSEGNTEIMLVAGFSGIGKTAVVNEVHKPIVRQRGYFIKGKFDQFKRDIPFSAWVQAFQNLMQQLLTESTTNVHKWQVKILEALGENGQVIIDVIPELEYLIGKQPEVPELEGIAAQNRFNLFFGKFIRLFATKEHPLVIFLDDLQWADSASLKLMQLLMSETDTRYLLLMGAYRDNEVFAAHPLILTLDEIRKDSATINQITLAPLNQPSLNCLIADTLSCPKERAMPLTELVIQKTKGNPFFATQFLKSLHEDELISSDVNCGYWQCDIAKVRALALTDDVVEFMAIQLQRLPENTQEVLKLAACIGNKFDLATLAVVHEKSQVETAANLWRALQEGLIIPITEVYKFFYEESGVRSQESGVRTTNNQQPTTNNQQLTVSYRFLHDRVQQAAYSLIPESQKQSTHLKVGQLLLRNTPEEEREEKIFDIVNQLNIGKELIKLQTERTELSQLNLIAGGKAKASTAHGTAKKYLTVGLENLAVDSWQSQYHLTLALYDLAAEVAYLNGDFVEMERLAEIVLQQSKTMLDKVKVYEVKIQAFNAQNQLKKSLNFGLKILNLLGIYLSEEPQLTEISRAFEETQLSLQGKRIEDLIDLPPMTDPQKLVATRILLKLCPAAYMVTPELLPLIIFQQIKLALEYGNAPTHTHAYANYGLILCGVKADLDSGYQFGQLALTLLEKLDAKPFKAMTIFVESCFIKHWKNHIKETLKPFLDSYFSGLETGDLEHAGYSAHRYCYHLFFSGATELSRVELEMQTYSDAINKMNQDSILRLHEIYHQVVLNLLGMVENPCRLIGSACDETKLLPLHISENYRIACYYFYLNKLILCYLFGEHHQAIENSVEAEKYLDAAIASVLVPIFHTYDSLSRLAVWSSFDSEEQKQILTKITENQEKMQKWATHAPMNYLHKFYIVEAERYRVLGANLEAIEMYDRAIELAHTNEYLNEEALAHELAAKFYLNWGKEKIAQVYLTDAYYAYARWGAKAKVEDLEQRYPQLLAPILNQNKSIHPGNTITTMTHGTITSTSSGISEILDLTTVIKASQALSVEIQLDKLLSTLMQVAIENAGASKGALILEQGGKLLIEATGNSGNSDITVLQSIPLETSNEIPKSLINYVTRTQEPLIYNNLPKEIPNSNEPYIIQHQPKSVLCLPIQHQGKAIAILYLENNLTTNAFTPDRLAVLKILASQAAISIENAQLYANLETKVEERTQELSQALSHLKTTQEELVQSEKMAALGQLVAGVAHEINTPLGAIRSSIGYISDFLEQNLNQLPLFFQQLSPERQQQFIEILARSQQSTITVSGRERRQLRKAISSQLQAQGIAQADTFANLLLDLKICDRLEPLVSLFQDSECENFLKTVRQFVRLQESTRDINTASERAAKIVFALKTYARFDQTGETIEANIIEGIETVLTLYQNQLKHGVKIIRNYQELPPIRCYFDELNQVWTNLIHNGLQAMNNQGTLTLDAQLQNGYLQVSITDSGKGIPQEIQEKIFQPFFTTKLPGEGSGLGLDIVKKIVEKHRGTIEFESVPGQTTFTVSLPLNSQQI